MTTTASEEHKASDIKLKNQTDSTTNDCNDKVFNAVGFYLYEDKKLKKVSLSLTLKSLVLNADDEIVKTIRMSDILGATFKSGDFEAKKIKLAEDQVLGKDVYVLKLHLLSKPPSKDENAVSKERKKPEPRKYEKFLLYSDNQETVIKWKHLILHAANNPEFKNLIQNHNINDLPDFERNLLVFVNFKSGQGKAANYWKKCRKLLIKAGCTINDIMMDEYSKLSNYIEKSSAQELQKFSAIVSVSGDGIPHDLINSISKLFDNFCKYTLGFYRRPDQEELIKIPIMLIPGGSCNALTQNILDKSGEDASLEGCCYVLAKGRSIKSDLTLYEREDGLRVYSFLSLTWAAPANIDLDSETLRTLGNVRFDIYGAWEVLTLKKYKAKFSYSETAKKPPDFTQDIKGEDWKTVDEDFSYLSIHNMPWIGMNYEALPMSDLEDGVNYFISIKGEEISRKTLLNTRKFLKPNPKVTSGEDLKDLGLSYGKIKSFRLEPYGDRLGKYSIDGEEYEVQRLQGWVIEKGITFVGIPEEHQDRETM